MTPTETPLPTAEPDPTSTVTREPVATSTPRPSPTVTQTPEARESTSQVQIDLVLSEIFARFGLSAGELSEAESTCLREWARDIDPAIFTSAAPPPGAMAEVIACIPDVFVSEMIAGMGLSAEDLSEAESTCLRGQMSSFDWSAVEEDAVAAVISDLFLCIPARFASLMVAESGLSDVLGFHPEDLGEEVALCIGNSMASLDWTALVTDDPAATAEFATALYSCAPKLLIDLVIKEFGMGAEYIGEVQEACLNKWASDIDWKNVFSDAPDAFLGLESGFRACLPEVHLSEDGDATG